MSQKTDKYQLPKWIQDLQENSYALELLISSGAIFSLFQLEDVFLDYMFALKFTGHLPGTGIFIILGTLAIKLLTIGFLAHLLMRTYWIGLLCVNYVFPKGIKKSKDRLKAPFKDGISENETLRDDIHKIDNASGILMYASVLTTMVIFGFILLVAVFISLPNAIHLIPMGFFWPIFLAIFIYHFDLLCFGLLRKIPGLSYITFPLFWLFDRVSLRVFYNRSFKIFTSNIPNFKLFTGFAIAILVGSFFSYNALYKFMNWPSFMDSRVYLSKMSGNEAYMSESMYFEEITDQTRISQPFIPAAIVTGDLLEIMIPYNIRLEENFTQVMFLSDDFEISVDDSIIASEWFDYYGQEMNTTGIKTYVDITNFADGKHVLKITSKANPSYQRTIPFWKDKE